MICCKCKRPIDRSYGRVTDLGNYCYQCAMQNEIEAKKAIVDLVNQARKETAREILIELIGHTFECEGWSYRVDVEDVKWLADKYGIEIGEVE